MVGGTWVAKKEVVAAQDWDTIRANCRQIHEIVARVRGGR
jgi:2-keto-3-deoxy-6-phosphogluconate aldolase